MRYTPAATMVAACSKAEILVGPTMASGSQTCSGNCADLASAPPNSNSPVSVSQVPGSVFTICLPSAVTKVAYQPLAFTRVPCMSSGSKARSVVVIINKSETIPVSNMASPTRLSMNA